MLILVTFAIETWTLKLRSGVCWKASRYQFPETGFRNLNTAQCFKQVPICNLNRNSQYAPRFRKQSSRDFVSEAKVSGKLTLCIPAFSILRKHSQIIKIRSLRADFLNAVYFGRGLTCTLGLTNDLIDCGQLRTKPHLRKAKPNHILKTVFSPRLATIYQVIG